MHWRQNVPADKKFEIRNKEETGSKGEKGGMQKDRKDISKLEIFDFKFVWNLNFVLSATSFRTQ